MIVSCAERFTTEMMLRYFWQILMSCNRNINSCPKIKARDVTFHYIGQCHISLHWSMSHFITLVKPIIEYGCIWSSNSREPLTHHHARKSGTFHCRWLLVPFQTWWRNCSGYNCTNVERESRSSNCPPGNGTGRLLPCFSNIIIKNKWTPTQYKQESYSRL